MTDEAASRSSGGGAGAAPAPIAADACLGTQRVVLGTMRMTSWGARQTVDEAVALLRAARDAGVTCIDTADIYGHYDVEALLGAAFAKDTSLRAAFVVATKFGIHLPCAARPALASKAYESSNEHVERSVATSTKDLGSAPDLLMVHRPDYLSHPRDVAASLASLLARNAVRHVGVSNFPPDALRAMHACCAERGVALAVNQVRLSVFVPAAIVDGTVDTCIALGVTVMAYSPLGADGAQFALPLDDPSLSDMERRVHTKLRELAAAKNTSADAVAIAWLLAHPARIYPVIGTTKGERVARIVKQAHECTLTRFEWYDLLAAQRGKEID